MAPALLTQLSPPCACAYGGRVPTAEAEGFPSSERDRHHSVQIGPSGEHRLTSMPGVVGTGGITVKCTVSTQVHSHGIRIRIRRRMWRVNTLAGLPFVAFEASAQGMRWCPPLVRRGPPAPPPTRSPAHPLTRQHCSSAALHIWAIGIADAAGRNPFRGPGGSAGMLCSALLFSSLLGGVSRMQSAGCWDAAWPKDVTPGMCRYLQPTPFGARPSSRELPQKLLSPFRPPG
jgi:hypothetical protein